MILSLGNTYAQKEKRLSISQEDQQKKVLNDTKVKATEKSLDLTIRNVDISKYPEITLILEAFNLNGEPLDTLLASQLHVLEDGVEKKILSIKKMSVEERVPVDFVFVVDKTGTMQKYMDAVRENIIKFTNSLMARGIDFRLGMILFSDNVEQIYQPNENVYSFVNWLNNVKAAGGNDEKENALEALKYATKINYRPAANRVAVIITDAPYHQKGENGDGVTNLTTKTAANLLAANDIRLFSITPQKLDDYKYLSDKTRGKVFDIDFPFSTILNNFSTQLTNLYALRYATDLTAIPDSLNISILNEKREELVKKTVPIIELGRKMIIDNLLYKTGSSELADTVPELDIVLEYMKQKPAVAIMIEGHTDAVGTNVVNDKLSLERAESVKRYLIKNGIQDHRIKTKGWGKRKPIASNETEFGRRLNRRTEVVIIAK
jgi:outer membrane protein OmpA-like peptidoglycan-associated protein